MQVSAAATLPTSVPDALSATAGDGLAGIGGDDFMKILLKQLQMQDPLKPMSNQEMVAQMATIRELEMNTRLSKKLEQLTDQQRFGAATALIGKHVKGTVSDADGNEFPVEGLVTSIRFTSKGEVMLELDTGEVLPLSALEQVQNPEGGATVAGAVAASTQQTADPATGQAAATAATPPASDAAQQAATAAALKKILSAAA